MIVKSEHYRSTTVAIDKEVLTVAENSQTRERDRKQLSAERVIKITNLGNSQTREGYRPASVCQSRTVPR